MGAPAKAPAVRTRAFLPPFRSFERMRLLPVVSPARNVLPLSSFRSLERALTSRFSSDFGKNPELSKFSK